MLGSIKRRSSISPQIDASASSPHWGGRSCIRTECLEALFAAASLGMGECPSQFILTLEASEKDDREIFDVQEKSGLC